MTGTVDESEYDIEAQTPNADATQARFVELSQAVATADADLDVAYGPDPRHRLDVFRAGGAERPAILFFHGGFWKAGSKETRRFPAPVWIDRGVTWVPVEYRLAPDARLDDIVADARGALAWFHANAGRYGCDPSALHCVGNSAGAHLVGMLAADGWAAERGLPADTVASATAISGLFELAPLVGTFANAWLSLDADGARRNSPIHAPPRAGLPMVVSVGGGETSAFRDQSKAYADACREAGADVDFFERPDADHLTIIGELAQPDSPLFQAVERQVARDT
jgi:arylformamidase